MAGLDVSVVFCQFLVKPQPVSLRLWCCSIVLAHLWLVIFSSVAGDPSLESVLFCMVLAGLAASVVVLPAFAASVQFCVVLAGLAASVVLRVVLGLSWLVSLRLHNFVWARCFFYVVCGVGLVLAGLAASVQFCVVLAGLGASLVFHVLLCLSWLVSLVLAGLAESVLFCVWF